MGNALSIQESFYGPQGPNTKHYGTDTWGRRFQEAFEGNDDENVLEKTAIITKHTWTAANIFLIFDVLCYNRGGIVNALTRMKYHYLPWIGCAVAYTTTVACVSAARGSKTDQKNHIVAGLAAGATLGKINRCFLTGMNTGFVFALLGYLYKDSRMNDWEMFPSILHGPGTALKLGTWWSHKCDFTMKTTFPARPGYWARSEDEVERVMRQGQLGDGDSYKKVW